MPESQTKTKASGDILPRPALRYIGTSKAKKIGSLRGVSIHLSREKEVAIRIPTLGITSYIQPDQHRTRAVGADQIGFDTTHQLGNIQSHIDGRFPTY